MQVSIQLGEEYLFEDITQLHAQGMGKLVDFLLHLTRFRMCLLFQFLKMEISSVLLAIMLKLIIQNFPQ